MENRQLIYYENVDIYQQDVPVLKKVSLKINTGEFIYLLGKVGCGKSSLLKSLYAEVEIQNGRAEVLGFNLLSIKNREIPLLRRKLGIIFQDSQLLPDRSVNANLEFVLHATGWKSKHDIDEQIQNVLTMTGMSTKGFKMPHQLSGGEQQRIVIARALLNSPELILADEPTGNLDPSTGREITELLHGICRSGTTVLMATHNLMWPEQYSGHILFFENQEISDMGMS